MIKLPSLLGPADDEAAGPPIREGAGFWIRALARAIDLLVHMAVGLACGFMAALLIAFGSALRGASPDDTLLQLSVATRFGFVAAVLGSLAPHVLAEGLHGSTIGKRLCGLTVIFEDGTPATLGAALKRNILYFFDALFFGMLAAMKMSESERRQRYGDVWAGTQVVRLSSLDAGAGRSWMRFALGTALGVAVDGTMILAELALRLA
jgi:uncharacterized RDD family membrane protein YckC